MCLPAMPTRFATRTRALACSRHHTVQVRASPVCRSFAVCAHHPPCAECCATNTCKDNSWSCDVWCVRGAGRRLPLYVLAGHWPRGSMCSFTCRHSCLQRSDCRPACTYGKSHCVPANGQTNSSQKWPVAIPGRCCKAGKVGFNCSDCGAGCVCPRSFHHARGNIVHWRGAGIMALIALAARALLSSHAGTLACVMG